jgi:hypothetical protein
MDRLADVLFIGFALRPEHRQGSDTPSPDLAYELITSRHPNMLVNGHLDDAIAYMASIFTEKVALPHVCGFAGRIVDALPAELIRARAANLDAALVDGMAAMSIDDPEEFYTIANSILDNTDFSGMFIILSPAHLIYYY